MEMYCTARSFMLYFFMGCFISWLIGPTGFCVTWTLDGIKCMNKTKAIKDCTKKKDRVINTSTEDKELNTILMRCLIVSHSTVH